MSLLFLAFLAAMYFLVRGKQRSAIVFVALMLAAMIAILIYEATTPLNLVF